MSTQHLCVAAKPLSACAFFSRMRVDAHAHKRALRGTATSKVCMASTSELKNPKLAELQALKEQNAKLKAEVRAALGALHTLGGRDQETLELLTGARSLEELAADIEWGSPEDEEPFWQRSSRKSTALPLILPPVPPVSKDKDTLHVVHISAELAPIAKVGGLGDAVAGLALACAQRGHNVECILPFYSCIAESQISNLKHDRDLLSVFKGETVAAKVYKGTVGGLKVILIKPDNDYFKGGKIYGGSYDELEAYLYFSCAAMEYLKQSDRKPQVIHYHDWQTAVVPVLYWDMYQQQGLTGAKVCLTIHNMENTGECKVDQLQWTGLDAEDYKVDEKAMDPRTKGHNPERLSLLKAGIVYSNATTTVSPTYRTELLTGGAAGWMKDTLQLHEGKFHGLLNGIDRALWHPERDAVLPAQYSAVHAAPKRLCKKYLLKGLGMASDEAAVKAPLVACITRLVPQKGIHLIKHAIRRTAEKGGSFVLLGSGPPDIMREFEWMAEEFKDNPRIKIMLLYNENLSHHVYAAADMILVPSMFEPCGLTQMVGLQYGAIPIVRSTGGLTDTVFDVDDEGGGAQNGFVFGGMDEASLDGALNRALEYYSSKPEWWAELAKKNMKEDNSWARSAQAYLDLYRKM